MRGKSCGGVPGGIALALEKCWKDFVGSGGTCSGLFGGGKSSPRKSVGMGSAQASGCRGFQSFALLTPGRNGFQGFRSGVSYLVMAGFMPGFLELYIILTSSGMVSSHVTMAF